MSLAGRVVLVTGAARRIGRCIAVAAAQADAEVAVHYNTSEADAVQTASRCGGKVFQADLADVAQIKRLFADVEVTYGRLDALVNNAARYYRTPIAEATEHDWDSIVDVNLKAVFFCSQAASRIMRPVGDGRIVNVSSLGGIRAWSGYGPYNASKAGVIHLTRTLAKELAPEIAVNSVAPGVTHFDEEIPENIGRLIGRTPMNRHASGEEIAEAVMHFLTCSKFTTGQVLAVDGGLSLHA